MSGPQDSDGIKLIVIGDPGVGKTCLTSRFIKGTYEVNPASTVGANYTRKTIEIPELKKYLILDIWDTAGQEKYRSIAKLFFKGAKIAILVYDITLKQSFENLKKIWYKELKENGEKGIVLGIAGNKSDLYLDEEVSEKDAKEFAKEIGASFRLTSAINNSGISDLINEVGIKFLDPNYVFEDEKGEEEKKKSEAETKQEQKPKTKKEEKRERKEKKAEEKRERKEKKAEEKRERKEKKEEEKREKKEKKEAKEEIKEEIKEEKKEIKQEIKEERKEIKKEEKKERNEIHEEVREVKQEKKNIKLKSDGKKKDRKKGFC